MLNEQTGKDANIMKDANTMNVKCNKKMPISEHGFTMVELLIVIAILGIIAAIGVWGSASLLPGYRLKGAAGTVRSDLYGAKIRAAKEKVVHVVTFTATGYTIAESGGATISSKTISDEFSGVSFDPLPTNNPISFQPRGTITNTTIALKNANNETKKIYISVAGRIKVE